MATPTMPAISPPMTNRLGRRRVRMASKRASQIGIVAISTAAMPDGM